MGAYYKPSDIVPLAEKIDAEFGVFPAVEPEKTVIAVLDSGLIRLAMRIYDSEEMEAMLTMLRNPTSIGPANGGLGYLGYTLYSLDKAHLTRFNGRDGMEGSDLIATEGTQFIVCNPDKCRLISADEWFPNKYPASAHGKILVATYEGFKGLYTHNVTEPKDFIELCANSQAGMVGQTTFFAIDSALRPSVENDHAKPRGDKPDIAAQLGTERGIAKK